MSVRTDIDGLTEVNIMGKTMYLMFTHNSVEKCKREKNVTPIQMVFFSDEQEKDISKNIMAFIEKQDDVIYLFNLGLEGFYEAYQVATRIGLPISALESPTKVSLDDLKIILSTDFKTLQSVNMAVIEAVKKLTPLSQENLNRK